MKQLEEECSTTSKESFNTEQLRRQQETPRVGRLLALYVDDSVADPTPFGDVRWRTACAGICDRCMSRST